MKPMLSFWHDTLGQALDAGIIEIKSGSAVMSEAAEAELRERFAVDGVKYNDTKQGHAPLESYKGKPTKKYAHISIYRAESGRYEVTSYVL